MRRSRTTEKRKSKITEDQLDQTEKPPTITNITLDASALEMLSQVQNKVVNAAALNGGFDKLISKVESIGNAQSQIVDRVDSIHNAIFDQNDGLFSLMHQSRLSRAQEKAEIDIQIANLDNWRENQQKNTDHVVKESEQINVMLQKYQAELDSMTEWRKNVSSTLKWIATALGGSVITVLGKFLHDWITLHWK